jgi:hypothetical protein
VSGERVERVDRHRGGVRVGVWTTYDHGDDPHALTDLGEG